MTSYILSFFFKNLKYSPEHQKKIQLLIWKLHFLVFPSQFAFSLKFVIQLDGGWFKLSWHNLKSSASLQWKTRYYFQKASRWFLKLCKTYTYLKNLLFTKTIILVILYLHSWIQQSIILMQRVIKDNFTI